MEPIDRRQPFSAEMLLLLKYIYNERCAIFLIDDSSP